MKELTQYNMTYNLYFIYCNIVPKDFYDNTILHTIMRCEIIIYNNYDIFSIFYSELD